VLGSSGRRYWVVTVVNIGGSEGYMKLLLVVVEDNGQ